jgi:DNA-binding LytR/AlgR family response regulator
MIEIAICDDDPAITGVLETLIKASGHLLPEPVHIRVFHRGEALLAALNQNTGGDGDPPAAPFDIVFLDIELGDTTGIEVAEHIRHGTAADGDGEGPALVFVSAHEAYCKELFQFDPAAFLPKPLDQEAAQAVLLRAYKKARPPRLVFVYHFNNNVYHLHLADILYFESKAHKIEIVTRTETRTFVGKLDEVEAQLRHPAFVRIHHSLLVNLANLERFEKSVLHLPGGRALPLVQNRQKEVRRKITDYYKGVFREAAPLPPQQGRS